MDSVLSADRWIWKDPRNCLTFPFWRRIIGHDAAIVLVHRNPLEVAASLRVRDGFRLPVGLALWERYVRSALTAAEGLPAYVTSYEELIAGPRAWCRNVATFLRARPAEAATVRDDELAAFVRTDLRHSIVPVERLAADPAVSDAQRALHAALVANAGHHDAFVAPELPAETPWVEALLAERSRSLRADREVARAELARRDAETRLAESSRSFQRPGPFSVLRALGR